MNIAVDLSPLQNAHRMRGIGYTLIHFLNNLSADDRAKHHFVFYALPASEALFPDPLEAVDTSGFNYEIRELKTPRFLPYVLPGRLNIIFGIFNRAKRFYMFYGNVSRVSSLEGVDVFLQADQSAPLPRGLVKKALIIYDLIPYILEADYWWSYRTARQRGSSRLRALHLHLKRMLQIRKVRRNTQKADKLLAISELTKHDFAKYLNVPKGKMDVTLLGVSDTKSDKPTAPTHRYVDTRWGFVKHPFALESNEQYLLYVGGADQRRKLEDVVTAFNNLRAQGHKLKLILAGDIMLGPSAITNEVIADSLATSSYIDDIIFMGFVDDPTRDWLYEHALAYVFPSRYEGFGLPILEAMVHGCPVISYRNEAVYEVAGDTPIYANNTDDLFTIIKELMKYNKTDLDKLREAGKIQASGFTWEKTSREMLAAVVGAAQK